MSRGHVTSIAFAAAMLSAPLYAQELATPQSFERLADRAARAAAIFTEATKVMRSPRCTNCHVSGDSPFQGDDRTVHNPPVTRGPADQGVPGLLCSSCHQDRNLELARIPGAPKWHLAPKAMAWGAKKPAAMCEQLKDPRRNGGRTLQQLIDYSAQDGLVAWGWEPGHGRSLAPGSQARFAALIAAWVELGAGCPTEPMRRMQK